MFDYDVEISRLRDMLYLGIEELQALPSTDWTDPRRAAVRRLEERIGDLTIAKLRGIQDTATDWIMPVA
jgi:hypothetical protein